MARPYLSIIIPVYNEARRMPLTLIDVDRHLSNVDFSYEIIVVNDGSTDQTAAIVDRFLSIINNLKFINNAENKGKGAVVRQGILAAKGNYCLFMDADNSASIIEFQKIIPYLQEGHKIIIGSRYVRGAQIRPRQPFCRRLLSALVNLWTRLLVLPNVKDARSGFQCFSADAAEKIFTLSKINSWAFNIESLAIARKLGYEIKEIPIFWAHHPVSYMHLSAYLRMLFDAIKVWWRIRRL